MKLNKTIMILCVFICGLLMVSEVRAAEGGGQVSSRSRITFYDGEKKPEEKPKPVVDPQKPDKSGILPQTGEWVKDYTLIGLTLLALVGFIYYVKRKKSEGEQS